MAGFQITYRPDSLENVVGNKAAVKAVNGLLDRELDDIPQAILFHGHPGCGKTTLARIFAAEIGCNEGTVFEYNSSNTRGIDTIRKIASDATLAPTFGDVQAFIIDECHQLTKDAQNAALKMLEDVPKNTFFLLCTTNPEKLIKPIRSRCTSITVNPLTSRDIRDLLQSIAEQEGDAEFPTEVFDAIADASDGVPRDAVKMLDMVWEMDDIDEMIEAVKQDIPDESGVKELCRALMEDAKHKKWKDIAELIKGLKEEPESVRRAILGYYNSVMLNTAEPDYRAAQIAECFESNYYDNGRTGLTLSCMQAVVL